VNSEVSVDAVHASDRNAITTTVLAIRGSMVAKQTA
jgi:hypothetical protein